MLAEKIKIYIETHGLKQIHVANESGIHNKTFNAIMNGNRKLLADEFVVICKQGLKINPAIFFDNEVQENGNK